MPITVNDYLHDQNILRSSDAPLSPAVTVILPTYARFKNGLMPRAVESVLAQTFTDFELIIVDDGSTDGSNDYIKHLRAHDSRVVHIRHETNSGLPALRCNEAIEIARGRWVAFQFDDDHWYPHALATLVASAERQQSPSIIVGTVGYLMDGHHTSFKFPSVPVNVTSLYQQNRLANNSVLIPRFIFDQYGMYDPHLMLRRCCDWDLWMRLVEYVPFIVLDEVIGEVEAGKADSIGQNIPVDVSTARFIQHIPRGEALTPARWRSYPIDTLTIQNVPLPDEMAQRAYEEHVVPYCTRFRHNFPQLEGFSRNARAPKRNTGYMTPSYNASNYLVFKNYDALANERGSFKTYHEWSPGLNPDRLDHLDMLNLFRVPDPLTIPIVERQLERMPVAYGLDDDFLLLHQIDSHVEYQPDHPLYKVLTDLLTQVDAVWCCTEPIRQSVHAYNRRTVPFQGAILKAWLPTLPLKSNDQGRLRIGFAGGEHRKREFGVIWSALEQIAHEFPDQVEFEFWGIDISAFPPLQAPIKQVGFSLSYLEYIQRLQTSDFHIMLAPLFDYPAFYLGKSIPKYFESAIAGAVGIFSDVMPYACLPADLTCLKTDNSIEGWLKALRTLINMPCAERDQLRAACVRHVSENYTVDKQIGLYEAAWRATEVHALTRKRRQKDGRPNIVYALNEFPADFNPIIALIETAVRYGFAPVVLLPDTLRSSHTQIEQHLGAQVKFAPYPSAYGSEVDTSKDLQALLALMKALNPALVHSLTFNQTLAKVCQRQNIPYVSGISAELMAVQTKEEAQAPDLAYTSSLTLKTRSAKSLETRLYYLHDSVSQTVFDVGFQRSTVSQYRETTRILVTDEIKPQHYTLDVIKAIAKLRQQGIACALTFTGCTVDEAYFAYCQALVQQDGLGDTVQFVHQNGTSSLKDADILLHFGQSDEFPQIIREAMAASVFVLTLESAVVREHIHPFQTGMLFANTDTDSILNALCGIMNLSEEESARILNTARHVAYEEFHPKHFANQLMSLYQLALQGRRTVNWLTPTKPAAHQPPVEQAALPPRYPMLVKGRVRYTLQPMFDQWNAVEVVVGTHARVAHGSMQLTVYAADGQRVRASAVALDTCEDSQWVAFRFDPIANSAGLEYQCEFEVKRSDRKTRISVYETHVIHPLSLRQKILRCMGVPLQRAALSVRMHYAE